MPPVCNLCLTSEATQTGSHLLSAFMIESLAGKRGEERTYQITGEADFDYTRNVGDTSIVTDYILCRGCEQRLAYVESYISQEFIHKIDLPTQELNFPIIKSEATYYIKECLRLNPSVFFLFIASLIFRISLSDSIAFAKFKLKAPEFELVRDTLHRLLPPYQDFRVSPNRRDWFLFIKNELLQQSLFSFIIISTKSKFNKTANMVVAPGFIEYPYSLMLNEFILLVFFGDYNSNRIQEDFFQVGPVINDRTALNEIGLSSRISFLSEEKWLSIIAYLRTMLKNQKVKSLQRHYAIEFFKKHHRFPSSQELAFILLQARSEVERT